MIYVFALDRLFYHFVWLCSCGFLFDLVLPFFGCDEGAKGVFNLVEMLGCAY